MLYEICVTKSWFSTGEGSDSSDSGRVARRVDLSESYISSISGIYNPYLPITTISERHGISLMVQDLPDHNIVNQEYYPKCSNEREESSSTFISIVLSSTLLKVFETLFSVPAYMKLHFRRVVGCAFLPQHLRQRSMNNTKRSKSLDLLHI